MSGSNSTISHYAAVKLDTLLFDPQRPSIGLSEATMSVIPNESGGKNITCTFKRDNVKPESLTTPNATNYMEIGNKSKYYVLTAFGPGKNDSSL